MTLTSSNTYAHSLTPNNPNTNEISVTTSNSEVDTSTNNDEWIAIIKSQNTWQFIIDFGNQYTFDPEGISTLKFTINSPKSTNDLLFGFSINTDQFISTSIPMNNDGRKNHIHPQCDISNTPTTTFAHGDISTLPQTNRHCDIAPGNGEHGCKWDTFQPKNAQNPKIFHYNGFPITFMFTNNPKENIFEISYKSAEFEPEFIQTCGFTAVNTNTFKIYIAGGEIGDTFTVSSFDIEYNGNGPKHQIQDISTNRWRMVQPERKHDINPVVYTSSGHPGSLKIAAQGGHDIAGKDKGSAAIITSIIMLICIICVTSNNMLVHRYYFNKYDKLSSMIRVGLNSNNNAHRSDATDSESGSLSSLSRTQSDPDGYEQDTEVDSMNESDRDPLDDYDHDHGHEYEYEEKKDVEEEEEAEVEDEMVERVLTLKPSDSVRVNHERVNAMCSNLSPSEDVMGDKYSQDSMISDMNDEHDIDHSFKHGGMVEKEIVEKSHTRMDSGIPQFDENEVMDIPSDLLGDMYGALM
eukprot:CAMPEP_0201592470 /NCGR_PEP_ID=MMETSP0190_2-20130828/190357_1 /ASSEMBLY_ACC=CAM_ASM_000263 /TAXON_ID=37353 /ORGANISM="Rosalina sp." /LENGTH=520 /DNA_ID=CAMNT_0048051257 /DNA_START=56 /DNA_END=1619 /DNA_ORIENTATION=-